MLARNELAEYIAEHYGTCVVGDGCCCLRVGFKGHCPHWVPVKAKNWDELRETMRSLYGTNMIRS